MALPDRWISWFFGAIPAGLDMIRRYKPQVLWSTYPIATAHLIGLTLHRLTGIPWMADFRDPMIEINCVTQERAPSDPQVWWARRWIERHTVQHCSRAIFAAPTALRLYAERYPDVPYRRWAFLPNGYDEECFDRAEIVVKQRRISDERIVLLHSGTLYPGHDRDPSAFFAALARLKRLGNILASQLRVVLRATGYDQRYQPLIRQLGIDDIVFLEPSIPYHEALAEMLQSSGLLLFQGVTSNPAIPGKLYEYLRARRPILALVDAEGDTAKILKTAGVGTLVPLHSEEQIAKEIVEFLHLVRTGQAPVMETSAVKNYAREAQAVELAKLFNSASSVAAAV
jgi:glycosyltransferase involved in cell wall biosynthesis